MANALGAAVSLIYSRGMGWRAVVASSRTIRYIAGACISVTGWACIARSAILSLLKYTYAFMPTANSTDSHRIDGLPNSEPMKTISADMLTSSTKVFIRLA